MCARVAGPAWVPGPSDSPLDARREEGRPYHWCDQCIDRRALAASRAGAAARPPDSLFRRLRACSGPIGDLEHKWPCLGYPWCPRDRLLAQERAVMRWPLGRRGGFGAEHAYGYDHRYLHYYFRGLHGPPQAQMIRARSVFAPPAPCRPRRRPPISGRAAMLLPANNP